MSGNVVHVTVTDYTTVYPSTLDSAIQIATIFTTMLTSPITPSSPASSIETTMSPSTTIIPLLPSGYAAPDILSPRKPWNENIANLMITVVLLMAILLISLFGYTIYQRFRGPCPSCSNRKRAVKVITKDMVKARESANDKFVRTPAYEDLDLERGDCGNWEEERDAARQEALAALTRPASVLLKPTMWERAKGFVAANKNVDKEPELESGPEPEPERKTSSSDDRFFTVDPVTQVFRKSTTSVHPYASHHSIDRAFDPPSPLPNTYYSRTKATTRSVFERPGSEQSEHYVPGPYVQSNSPPAISEPFNYSAYLSKQCEPAFPGALNIGDAKRRSRTYGGLPVPEDFEDVDVNQ